MDKDKTIQKLTNAIQQQNSFILELMNSNLLTDKQQYKIAEKYNELYLNIGKYIKK